MYTLNLTDEDLETIYYVGNRYGWSHNLLDIGVSIGENTLTESEAWYFNEGVEEDEGTFPMLDDRSELYTKFNNLLNSIV